MNDHEKNRIGGRTLTSRTWALFAALVLPLAGCDILDVDNPNNLVEEDLQNASAAAAIANGSLATVSRAIGLMAAPYATVSDELLWIGSRDAWNQLNLGHHRDYANEFTDAAFPNVGEARWMADLAINQIGEFVSEAPDDDALALQHARAYLFGGIIYMAIGEAFDDFALSDKTEAAAPIGPNNMDQMFNTAVSYLDQAASIAATLGDDGRTLRGRALAVRARAKHSLAVWNLLNPAGSVPAEGLVSAPGAAADAQAALDVLGEGSDWRYDLAYSASTISNDMSFQVNERGELQLESDLVVVDPEDPTTVQAVKLEDPIDGIVDPALTASINRFIGKSSYASFTVASERMMHLIIAEDALAGGDSGGFADAVNAVRDLDGLSDYTGQIPAEDMLIHARRVNLFLMNLRLNDMFRFGIPSGFWQANSAAASCNGVELPITIVEVLANQLIDGQAPTCPS